jgi:hypothetical protein
MKIGGGEFKWFSGCSAGIVQSVAAQDDWLKKYRLGRCLVHGTNISNGVVGEQFVLPGAAFGNAINQALSLF